MDTQVDPYSHTENLPSLHARSSCLRAQSEAQTYAGAANYLINMGKLGRDFHKRNLIMISNLSLTETQYHYLLCLIHLSTQSQMLNKGYAATTASIYLLAILCHGLPKLVLLDHTINIIYFLLMDLLPQGPPYPSGSNGYLML